MQKISIINEHAVLDYRRPVEFATHFLILFQPLQFFHHCYVSLDLHIVKLSHF